MDRSFRRENGSLAAIVEFVREFADAEGIGEPLTFDMDLVLEELFTNQVKYGGAPGGDITIRLVREARGVVMTILDYDAVPFDPTRAPEANTRRTVDEYTPGGLGIHFVRQLSERFEYQYLDRTCTITVSLRDHA